MLRYRPYKQKAEEWKSHLDQSRTHANGREILCVEIGECIVLDDHGAEEERIEVTEDIYKDILLSIFGSKDKYVIRATLGKTPALVITYENNLVIHNEYIPNMIKKIEACIPRFDLDLIKKALSNFILNEKGLEKKSDELKEYVNRVNHICETNYPTELILLVTKDYFVQKRSASLSGREEELDMMPMEDLLKAVIDLALSERNELSIEENQIKDELIFRILKGELTLSMSV